MKSVLLSLSLLLCVSAHPRTMVNGCLEKVAGVQNWVQLTDAQLSCLSETEEFNDGMKFLCLGSKRDLSKEFKAYLDYKSEALIALENFKNAKTAEEKAFATLKMKEINQDWSLGGYKGEVSSALNKVSRSKFNCTQ